jgi:hypothetical protein
MRSAALVGPALALAVTAALAQSAPPGTNPETGARPGNEIGTGNSLPLSDRASNIGPGDTPSTIAPRLPSPDVGPGADPRQLLQAARGALAANRSGQAQEALERAETRLLDRVVDPSQIRVADTSPVVEDIRAARMALGAGERSKSAQMIDAALAKLAKE